MKRLLTILLLLPLFCFSQIATRYQYLAPPVIVDTAGGGGNDIPPREGPRKNLLYEADAESDLFTKPNPYPFHVYNSDLSTSITRSTDEASTGTYSYKFTVNKTDPQFANGRRAELSNYDELTNNGYNFERWVGFRIFIPSDWTFETNSVLNYILQQYHDYETNGETGFKSAFQFEISNDKWSYTRRWCATENMGDLTEVLGTDATLSPNPTVVKDAWTSVVIHLKFTDPTGVDANNGRIQIWINGLLCEDYTGKLGYKHAQPPFFKIGNYAWMWNNDNLSCCGNFTVVTSRTHYLDDIRIGNQLATYNDVAP